MRGVLTKLVPATVFLLLALGVTPALATHVQCGDVITEDTTLDSDVVGCSGSYGGIRIGDGVTLDLGGHLVSSATYAPAVWMFAGGTVRNGRVESAQRYCSLNAGKVGIGSGIGEGGGAVQNVHADMLCVHQTADYSIENVVTSKLLAITESRNIRVRGAQSEGQSGFLVQYTDDTTVYDARVASAIIVGGARNTVQSSHVTGGCYTIGGSQHAWVANECGEGIGLDGADDARVVGNTVEGATYGISSQFNEGVLIADNHVRDSVVGIQLYRSSGGVIERNRATRNQFGILLTAESEDNLLVRNRADRNLEDGIALWSSQNSLQGNHANRNGDLGIDAAAGSIDLGRNKARANGNRAQCVGVSCR